MLVLVRVLVVSLVVVLVVVLHLQLLSLELRQVQRKAGPAFHPPVQIVLFPQNSKQTETVTTSKVELLEQIAECRRLYLNKGQSLQ